MQWTDILILIALGLGIAIVTTMSGVGGGVFFVPVLIYLEGLQITVAREISQFAILGTSLVGSITYLRQKRVNVRVGLIAAAFSVAGVLVYKYFFAFLSNAIVTLVFALFLLFLAVYYITPILYNYFKKRNSPPQAMTGEVPTSAAVSMGEMPSPQGVKWVLKAALLFFVGGFVAAMLGVGGGIIFVPTLSTILDFPIHFATATSSFTIVFNAITNVLVAGFRGQIDYVLGSALIVGAMPGAYIGAKYSRKVPKDPLKCVIAAVICAVGILMLTGV